MLNLDKVTDLAKENGWSNTFLAKKLGRSSASLFTDWRKGKSKPTDSDIEALADLLNTTAAYLTDQTDQKEKHLANEGGNKIIQRTLKNTGLLDSNGALSEKGGQVISDFIAKNAEMLKKLIET